MIMMMIMTLLMIMIIKITMMVANDVGGISDDDTYDEDEV